MSYLPDANLNFLEYCADEDLGILVDVITGPSFDRRFGEALTSQKNYKSYFPIHSKYWREIGEEIQLFGGNSIPNRLRGHGVYYEVVLSDVCRQVGVGALQGKAVAERECLLLAHILHQSLEKMSERERKELLSSLDIPTTDFSKQAVIAAIQGAVVAGSFASYTIAVVVANAVARTLVGRGLGLAANAGLTRAIGMVVGPIGWLLNGIWAAYDLAGPAFRVTIPCCIQIAYMRSKVAQATGKTVAETPEMPTRKHRSAGETKKTKVRPKPVRKKTKPAGARKPKKSSRRSYAADREITHKI